MGASKEFASREAEGRELTMDSRLMAFNEMELPISPDIDELVDLISGVIRQGIESGLNLQEVNARIDDVVAAWARDPAVDIPVEALNLVALRRWLLNNQFLSKLNEKRLFPESVIASRRSHSFSSTVTNSLSPDSGNAYPTDDNAYLIIQIGDEKELVRMGDLNALQRSSPGAGSFVSSAYYMVLFIGIDRFGDGTQIVPIRVGLNSTGTALVLESDGMDVDGYLSVSLLEETEIIDSESLTVSGNSLRWTGRTESGTRQRTAALPTQAIPHHTESSGTFYDHTLVTTGGLLGKYQADANAKPLLKHSFPLDHNIAGEDAAASPFGALSVFERVGPVADGDTATSANGEEIDHLGEDYIVSRTADGKEIWAPMSANAGQRILVTGHPQVSLGGAPDVKYDKLVTITLHDVDSFVEDSGSLEVTADDVVRVWIDSVYVRKIKGSDILALNAEVVGEDPTNTNASIAITYNGVIHYIGRTSSNRLLYTANTMGTYAVVVKDEVTSGYVPTEASLGPIVRAVLTGPSDSVFVLVNNTVTVRDVTATESGLATPEIRAGALNSIRRDQLDQVPKMSREHVADDDDILMHDASENQFAELPMGQMKGIVRDIIGERDFTREAVPAGKSAQYETRFRTDRQDVEVVFVAEGSGASLRYRALSGKGSIAEGRGKTDAAINFAWFGLEYNPNDNTLEFWWRDPSTDGTAWDRAVFNGQVFDLSGAVTGAPGWATPNNGFVKTVTITENPFTGGNLTVPFNTIDDEAADPRKDITGWFVGDPKWQESYRSEDSLATHPLFTDTLPTTAVNGQVAVLDVDGVQSAFIDEFGLEETQGFGGDWFEYRTTDNKWHRVVNATRVIESVIEGSDQPLPPEKLIFATVDADEVSEQPANSLYRQRDGLEAGWNVMSAEEQSIADRSSGSFTFAHNQARTDFATISYLGLSLRSDKLPNGVTQIRVVNIRGNGQARTASLEDTRLISGANRTHFTWDSALTAGDIPNGTRTLTFTLPDNTPILWQPETEYVDHQPERVVLHSELPTTRDFSWSQLLRGKGKTFQILVREDTDETRHDFELNFGSWVTGTVRLGDGTTETTQTSTARPVKVWRDSQGNITRRQNVEGLGNAVQYGPQDYRTDLRYRIDFGQEYQGLSQYRTPALRWYKASAGVGTERSYNLTRQANYHGVYRTPVLNASQRGLGAFRGNIATASLKHTFLCIDEMSEEYGSLSTEDIGYLTPTGELEAYPNAAMVRFRGGINGQWAYDTGVTLKQQDFQYGSMIYPRLQIGNASRVIYIAGLAGDNFRLLQGIPRQRNSQTGRDELVVTTPPVVLMEFSVSGGYWKNREINAGVACNAIEVNVDEGSRRNILRYGFDDVSKIFVPWSDRKGYYGSGSKIEFWGNGFGGQG